MIDSMHGICKGLSPYHLPGLNGQHIEYVTKASSSLCGMESTLAGGLASYGQWLYRINIFWCWCWRAQVLVLENTCFSAGEHKFECWRTQVLVLEDTGPINGEHKI